MPVVAKPFINDPAKQERFEQFLKDKYQGGLRSTESGRASHKSEAACALERLDFEVAAEAIKKGKWSKEISTSLTGGMEFTPGGFVQAKDTQTEDAIPKEVHVKRTEYQWRPSSILCKRFDLTDPYMGKPPQAPRSKSKIETLIFTSDSVKASKEEETIIIKRDSYIPQPEAQGISKDVADVESGVEVEVENVERPVDLYKAIFSDDEDDEEDISIPNEVGNPEKKVEAANTTLNRLIAGDFLESLGKELGLEVPPELPSSTNKAINSASPKETTNANSRINNTYPVEEKPSTLYVPHTREIVQDHRSQKKEPVNANFMGNSARSNSKHTDTASLGNQVDKTSLEKGPLEDKKLKTPSRRHRSLSRSSSEDESRKRSRHRHRHSDSDSDSSSDHRDQHHSRSKGKKKGSSREKSSRSRSHSKHHKRRSRDSPSRYDYSPEKERSETKRDKHRRRD